MTADDVAGEVKAILAKELELDVSAISDDISVENMPSWDSMRHVGIVFAIEDRFGIEFSQWEIEEMYSFEEILEAIGKKL